jgi:EpsI family protein
MRRNATWVGAVLLAAAVLYWPDTLALGRYWLHKDLNAQAGILIALLSVFLLIRARERFERISLTPVPWACLPLSACAAVSLIFWRAGILTLQLFFLPAILWLAVLGLLGRQAARGAAFALGFLYFALPGWDLLRPALQHLTAVAVGMIGPLVGLPITISGMTASLPGGVTFVIERACSGADFLAVGLAIATLHGELEQAAPRRRAGLIAGMFVLAILSNWLRVILILTIGYLSHLHNALATRDHAAFGWVIFACALLLFIWWAGRTGIAAPDATVVGASDAGVDARASIDRRYPLWSYSVVVAGLLVVPALMYMSLLANEAGANTAAFQLPPGSTPWHGSAGSTDALWQPMFVGAHAEQRALYRSADGRTVEVVGIGFAKQTQGAQILNDENSLLGDQGLAIQAVALVDGGGIPHSEIVAIDPHGRRSLIWSVIDIGGHLFGEPLFSQLWYGARSVIGAPYSALFALKAQCDDSCEGARTVLADFLRANGPALFAAVPQAADGRQGAGPRQEM